MKGFVGLVFLGICIVIAAAVFVGAITFPEAVSFIWGILWWIVWAVIWIVFIILAFIGVVFIIAAVCD